MPFDFDFLVFFLAMILHLRVCAVPSKIIVQEYK